MRLQQKINHLFLKSEIKKCILLFFGLLLMGVFEVIGVSAIVPFIAVIVSPEIIFENNYLFQVYSFLNFKNSTDFLLFLGVFLISTILISNLYQAAMIWFITYFSQMMNYRLSLRLLEHYLSQPYDFFLTRNSSDLSQTILAEVGRVTMGVIMQSLQGLSKILIVIYLIALLIYVNPMIAFSSALFLGGIYSIIYTFFKKKLNLTGIQQSEAQFAIFKAINEAMSGIKDVKLKGREQEFTNRFSLPAKNIATIISQKVLIASLPKYFLEVVAFGGITAIIISLISIEEGSSSSLFPIISLYVMIGYRLLPAFQQIYTSFTEIRFNLPAFDNLAVEFSKSKSIKKSLVNQVSISFRDKLELNKISFEYESAQTSVLNELDLTISHNSTVGLIGATGSGKTTLIDIVLGLIVPDSGKITVDGVEINTTNKFGWQQKIGYVPQSIYLTDDTILSNIAFAVPFDEIKMEQVVQAAKMANLDSFIKTLPDQYETFVGERGLRLSGGQKQRIGIARALYHDPSILILDEATSSLDGITEEVIIEAINNLSHKKTIIMIAHRLSTLKDCDIIHLMDNGKVIASGTFNYLMDNNEQFRKMAKNA